MKYPLILVFSLVSWTSFSQSTMDEFDPLKWEPPYILSFPEGWGVERFPIPIIFAPNIPYQGIEDIRFAPGWSKEESPEYWSYAFLWYLDGHQKITEKSVENNLREYYTGLVSSTSRDSLSNHSKTAKSTIKKGKTQNGDKKTFYGSVYFNDYKSNKPIALYCKVHLKFCNKQNKTFLFFELSPKYYSENVWLNLDKLWSDFRCEKP